MIIIHGVPISVHTRKAIVTAALKNLDYRVEPVIPFKPPPGWDDLSPTGLIPVMQDGEFALADSSAICHYLERKRPTPSIFPTDAENLARALWFDAYAGGTLYRHVVHGLFVQKVIRPGILNQPTDQSAIDSILANTLPKVFGYLESEARGAFLVGDALSIADIAIASNFINYQYLGFSIDRRAYPRLDAYVRRVIGHPAFGKALADERPFADGMGLDASFLMEAA